MSVFRFAGFFYILFDLRTVAGARIGSKVK